MESEMDLVVDLLLLTVVALFAVIFLVNLIIKLYEFSQELDYLNREIERTTGREQRHWKREKRRLWLSLLPFYSR